MKYTLVLGLNGELNGWQYVEYELNGQNIEEGQFFINGRSVDDMAFSTVSGVGKNFYNFTAKNWGTVENMRNAAEMFAADDLFNVVLQKSRIENRKMVVPFTEEVLV